MHLGCKSTRGSACIDLEGPHLGRPNAPIVGLEELHQVVVINLEPEIADKDGEICRGWKSIDQEQRDRRGESRLIPHHLNPCFLVTRRSLLSARTKAEAEVWTGNQLMEANQKLNY